MTKKINIVINNKKVACLKDQTVLEVAKENEIDIPALCFHSDLNIKSNCRLCVVEIKAKKGVHTACSTKVEPEMEIITNSPKIRKINLELILAQHCEKDTDCIQKFNCQLLNLAKKYKVRTDRFFDRKKDYPSYPLGPSLVFDSSKCIDCRNCVDVCEKQGVNFLEIKKRENLFQVLPSKDIYKDCIYCGQCIVHCPTGAFKTVRQIEVVEELLQDKETSVIFQFAPSIRTSIGEEFNLPYGLVVTEKLVAGIKKLGADKVFDVSVGADFTTFEEAKELIERLEGNKNLPMLTSCCPSWVKFVEFYYPEFIPFLTSVRSPHIILGGLIKTFWAEKAKIDPKKVTVVSIMPCVSKKYEIQREELKINNLKPVDYVLTTRELACLFIKHKIDLKKIVPKKADDPLGVPSGAGVIYGVSGGVMESALRTAYERLTKKNLPKVRFEKVKGMEDAKEATIKIKDRLVKIAVVNGIGNAKKILEKLKENPKLYEYIEIMSCFGGCIGGGGQPVPVDDKIRKKRAEALYQIDAKKEIRCAHESPVVKEVYREFFNSKEKIHCVCHTKFLRKKSREVKIH